MIFTSHPLRVRGLKRFIISSLVINLSSHPLRVRGLKQVTRSMLSMLQRSHPLRVRGLKLRPYGSRKISSVVAPPAGAWIETHKKQKITCNIF